MGYYKGEDIEACEANGIMPYVARPERGSAVANGRFPKERFRYDPVADAYHCPRRPASGYPLPLGHERPCLDPVFQLRGLCRLHH